MAIHIKELNYEEVDTQVLFETGNSSDSDATIVDLLGKNIILNEEVKGVKRENEIQLARLCKVTEQKKKAKEDKVFTEEDKRLTIIRLEERTYDV